VKLFSKQHAKSDCALRQQSDFWRMDVKMQNETYEFGFTKKYVLSAQSNVNSGSINLTTVHAQAKGSIQLPFMPSQGTVINPVGKVDGMSYDLHTHKFELIFQMSTFYPDELKDFACTVNRAKFAKKITDQCEHALSLNVDIYVNNRIVDKLRFKLGQTI
jgi:hypothetical protein